MGQYIEIKHESKKRARQQCEKITISLAFFGEVFAVLKICNWG